LPTSLQAILRVGYFRGLVTTQVVRSQNSEVRMEESRTCLILAKDLEYGDVSELSPLLEEGSQLLEAYLQAILDSNS
jgi:hypothetical protein